MDTSIFEKILSGSATEQELQKFKKWLQLSESNSVHYEQLKLIWEKTGRIPAITHFDESKAKQIIRDRVTKNNAVVRKVKLRRTWMAAAASILILLGIGTLGYQQAWIGFGKNIEYSAQNAVKEISLPDGSQVWLNTNSSLIVPLKFTGSQRNVELNGEAYFEVARDESRPFKIKTGNTVTQVLGTSFNIKMDTLSGNINVVVNTGKVAVYQKRHKNNGVFLVAGDMAEFNNLNNEIIKTSNNDLNYLAWKTHILTFEASPLKEVCKVLANYYHKNITTDLVAANYVITGKFEKESVDDILSTIQLTLDVKTIINGNQIIIYK